MREFLTWRMKMLKNLFSGSSDIMCICVLCVYVYDLSEPLTPFLRLSITGDGEKYE